MTTEELEKIIILCKQSEKPTYLKIRAYIALDKTSHFKHIEAYEVDKETGEVLTKKPQKFVSAFKVFHQLRLVVSKALSKTHWHDLSQNRELIDSIATIFSLHKSDEKIALALDAVDLSLFSLEEQTILKEALLSSISFSEFISLSLKALDKLLPLMREGKRYDEAIALLGYAKVEGTKQKFLRALNKEEQHTLTNPVVKRAIAQTRKVINALIRKYHSQNIF